MNYVTSALGSRVQALKLEGWDGAGVGLGWAAGCPVAEETPREVTLGAGMRACAFKLGHSNGSPHLAMPRDIFDCQE